MFYQSVRNFIMKNEIAFMIARFFFTPFRVLKEYIFRRKKSNLLIKKYCELTKDTPKIFYFGIPEHNNLGDIAQTYCTKRWIKDNFPEHFLIETITRVTFDKKFNKFMNDIMGKNDLIIFQSGYCTRYKNPDHLMHLHIAEKFPNTKLVVLPQTVKLDNKRDLSKTKSVFLKCKKLLFITRDAKSCEYAKAFIDEDNLECYPDIVTSLIGRVPLQERRHGAMLCVRNDDEKFYSDAELNSLQKKLEKIYGTAIRTDTNSEKSADEVFYDLETEIVDKIKEFARYECVITDRYHGTIFSLIANTPVIVIKTNDHKVTSALEWFENRFDNYAVQLAVSLEDAIKKANEVHDIKPSIENNDSLYEDYYKRALYQRISSI